MTTATATTDIILDALLASEDGLTLAELAQATGLPCGTLRLAIDALGLRVESALSRPVVEGPGDDSGLGRSVRVYRVADVVRCAREADLVVLAEQADEETLRETPRETLRAACTAIDLRTRRKDTREALISAILAHRAAIHVYCVRCGDEPVDVAGAVCTVCDEAAQEAPTPRAPRKPAEPTPAAPDLRVRVRRPDVALALTSDERDAVEAVVRAAPSQRAAQRDAGHWLADRSAERFCDAEVLRTILRTHGVLNVANFTINAKKEGWARVEADNALKGWTIAKHSITIKGRTA
jgi:hypothetical protein